MNQNAMTIFFAALFFSLPAQSASVVSITDGDTLVIHDGTKQTKVRVAAIDAPEKKQARGMESRQKLASLCFGKSVTITGGVKDRYGRTVADVKCNGVDVSTEMVRSGMAWVYEKYVTNHRFLFKHQTEARNAKRGIWSDSQPIPPWIFRKK